MKQLFVFLSFFALFPFVFPQGLTTPQQIHASLANVSGATGGNVVGISWVTRTATSTSTVRFGTASGIYSGSATGFRHTYTQSGWKGIIHDVLLPNLIANTRYYYIAGDSTGGWSSEFSFVTQPPVNSKILVMAVGDIATSSNTRAVLAGSLKEQYSLALIAGDLSYADGDNTTWDNYFNLIQPQAANSFWMSAIGNHEAAAKDYNGVPYLSRSILPNNELWYSFNYGPIHVLVFSTEHPTGPTSPQYQFIDQDLKAAYANRANIPFIITVAHKPIYTSNLAHGPELTVRANIEPLMVRYGVDIAIWGHNHCYERSYPMQYDKTNNTRTGSSTQPYNTVQAPIHITVGSGGKELYPTWATKPAWSYYREAAFGYAIFSVTAPPRTLHWQWVKTNGQVPDQFFINK